MEKVKVLMFLCMAGLKLFSSQSTSNDSTYLEKIFMISSDSIISISNTLKSPDYTGEDLSFLIKNGEVTIVHLKESAAFSDSIKFNHQINNTVQIKSIKEKRFVLRTFKRLNKINIGNCNTHKEKDNTKTWDIVDVYTSSQRIDLFYPSARIWNFNRGDTCRKFRKSSIANKMIVSLLQYFTSKYSIEWNYNE